MSSVWRSTTIGELCQAVFSGGTPTSTKPEYFGGSISCFASLLDRRIENELQAQTLVTLRDTLLPRLISGQLRLPEAEVLVADA